MALVTAAVSKTAQYLQSSVVMIFLQYDFVLSGGVRTTSLVSFVLKRNVTQRYIKVSGGGLTEFV